jgi:hypothetical protein
MEMGEKSIVVTHVGKESMWIVKSKCIGGCSWQKCYNENVMVKFQFQSR